MKVEELSDAESYVDDLTAYTKAWHVQRCDIKKLPRLLAELEASGFQPWNVVLEHSEFTVISYMTAGERERRGIRTPRLDRLTALVEPSSVPGGLEDSAE